MIATTYELKFSFLSLNISISCFSVITEWIMFVSDKSPRGTVIYTFTCNTIKANKQKLKNTKPCSVIKSHECAFLRWEKTATISVNLDKPV